MLCSSQGGNSREFVIMLYICTNWNHMFHSFKVDSLRSGNLQNNWTSELVVYHIDISSYRISSYLLVSPPISSYLLVSYVLVSYLLVSYVLVSYLLVSYLLVSYPILSYPIISYCILSYPILSIPLFCILSHRIVSCVHIEITCFTYWKYSWSKKYRIHRMILVLMGETLANLYHIMFFVYIYIYICVCIYLYIH